MFDLIASAMSFDAAPQAASGWVSKSPMDDYWYQPRGQSTNSGITVTEEIALTYSTVFNCIGKISKTIATLPRFVYERDGENSKTAKLDHDLHNILHNAPNDEMGKVPYETSQMANILGWGTRYSEIVRNRRSNRIEELWPLESRTITPGRNKQGRIVYEHRPDGAIKPEILPSNRVLCIPSLSLNGLIGLTPIGWQRESIGLGITATRFGAKLFENGTVLRGYLQTPKKMKADTYERLKESWNREFKGWENAHSTPILEDETEYHSVGINPDDAQFLETRKFQAIEVCGMFDVPPHKIGILDNATFSNIEHQAIQWVVDCIAPWCILIESEMNRQLLGNDPKLFVSHVLDGLLRGDIEARYNAYGQGRLGGWLTTNDIRRLENMNPKDGGDDDWLTPLNMRVGDEPRPESGGSSNGSSSGRDKEDTRGNRPSAMFPVVEDVARRMVTKETKAVENAFGRMYKGGDADAFMVWLDDFYAKHEQDTASNLVPVATAIVGEAGARAIAERAARKYATVSLAAMRDCAISAPQRIPQELNAWLYARPSKIETLAAEWSRCLQ